MKNRMRLISLILSFLMIISSFSFAFAVEFPKNSIEKVQVKDMSEKVRIIIELENKALFDYSQAKTLGAKSFMETETAEKLRKEIVNVQVNVQNKILNNVNSEATFKYSYTSTFNGFTAEVLKEDIAKIKLMPEVKRVYRDTAYEIPTPQMITSEGMINANKVWNTGYKGQGRVVAVLDTGVDVNHELMLLSDDTIPKLDKQKIEDAILSGKLNAKLEVIGKDEREAITIDNLDEVYANRKFPFSFDYSDGDTDAFADRSDHGVHVSGTVAANGTRAEANGSTLNTDHPFDGVAPEAQILGMKVFSSNSPYAYASDTLAAIEDSIILGADAINLSLGSAAGFTFEEGDEFDYEPSFKRARDAGIIVSVSAGNEDRIYEQSFLSLAYEKNYSTTANVDSGLVGSPSTKYHATSVASIENLAFITQYIQGPNSMKIKDFSDSSAEYIASKRSFIEILDGRTLEYVVAGMGKPEDFVGKDLTGKIALIQRGEINFSLKVNNATSAGAIGCIVYNNAPGMMSMILDGVTGDVPAIFISQADGVALKNAINKQITVNSDFIGSFPNDSASEMSNFTSWGTTPDLKIKPEITTPGGQIYSTLPNDQYGMMSGTSMAAPHLAGGAAVIQQYVGIDPRGLFTGMTGEQKADVIEALLMSTAKVVKDPTYENIYSPRRQGAGLMDLEAAVMSDVYLMNSESGKAKVELFDNIGDSFDIEFDVINLSSTETYEYDLSGSIFTEEFMQVDTDFYVTISEAFQLEDSEMLVEDERINPIGAVSTGSAIVTVGPNATTRVKVSVKLNSDETEFLSTIFKNGFFVEGFVELLSRGSQPDLSIPYMGFYGDWTKAPAMDGSMYYDESLSDFYYINSYAYSLWDDGKGNLYYDRLGGNYEDSLHNYDWIAFSPNGDGIRDEIGYRLNLLRNAKKLTVDIYKDNVKIINLDWIDENGYTRGMYERKSFVLSSGDLLTYDLPLWDGTDVNGDQMPNGQYEYVITTWLDYDGLNSKQIKKIPFILDTETFKLGRSVNDTANKKIKINVIDNGYISVAVLKDLGFNDISDLKVVEIPAKTHTFEFDYSAVTDKYAILLSEDLSGNSNIEIVEVNPEADDIDGIFKVTFKTQNGNLYGKTDDFALFAMQDWTILQPDNPTLTNYSFLGWFEEGKTTAFNFATPITSDLTLTAKWILNYTPDPDNNGGSPGGGASNPKPTPIPTPNPEPVVPIDFGDTTNHWAKDDIGFIAGLGLVNGTSANNFSPDSNMNRGMIVTILGRLAKIDINNFTNSSSFNDVAGGQYYAPFVEWAAQLGLVNGTGNGSFSPEAPLTREQLAHMLMKYAELMNLNLKSNTENKVQFADEANVSAWATESVQKARELGIIIGSNNSFGPDRPITRAEVITMLARFIRLIEQQ